MELSGYSYSIAITYLEKKLTKGKEIEEYWRKFNKLITEAQEMNFDTEITQAAKSFVTKVLEISPETALMTH